MAASWLKTLFRPLSIYVGGILQIRDDRVNFRNGFAGSQVPDEFGVNRLTLDVDADGIGTPLAIPDTIASRNGSAATAFGALTSGAYNFDPPQDEERVVPIRWDFDPDDFTLNLFDGTITDTASTASESRVAIMEPDARILPHGSELYKLAVYLSPVGGHRALPSVQPILGITRFNDNRTTETLIESVEAALGSVAAYQAGFWLELELSSPEIINRQANAYRIYVSVEESSNAIVGTIVRSLKLWTRVMSL